MNAPQTNAQGRPPGVYAMQVRYFELMRKRVFIDLYWVATENESKRMWRDGGYAGYAHRCCPDMADNVEMKALEDAIERAGVRMYM